MLEITERLIRLEKSNRRLRIAAYGFPLLMGLAVLMGAENPAAPLDGKFRHVTAEKIVVRGKPGTPGIVLSANKDGASIQLLNGKDVSLANLAVVDGASATLQFHGDAAAKAEIGVMGDETKLTLRASGQDHDGVQFLATERGGGAALIEAVNPKDGKKSVGFGFIGTDVVKQFDLVANARSEPAAPDQSKAAPVETPEAAEKRKADAEKSDADATAKEKEPPTTEDPAKKAEAEKNEKAAAAKLRSAELSLKNGYRAAGRGALQELIKDYPDTKAAEKARQLLK